MLPRLGYAFFILIAGVNALSKAEITQISDYNAAYKQNFGFPFIIAVRML